MKWHEGILILSLGIIAYYVIKGIETQMLNNSDFEKQYWITWQSGTQAKFEHSVPGSSWSGIGKGGSNAVAIRYPSREAGRYAVYVQYLKAIPGKTYNISGWMKTEDVSGTGAMILPEWKNQSGGMLSAEPIMTYVTGNSEATYQGTVTAPADAYFLAVTLRLDDASGRAIFDNIKVT